MLVRKISGRKFAKWNAVDIELPATGLVLVTGDNGHGKSTIVEAVAQCVWGQSIRGQPGWRQGEKSGVAITLEDGEVTRSASDKGTQKLHWRVGEDGAGGYPTRTKSQEALDSCVGSFNVWRHACTFHTRDAARFTGATDAERKRLLEEVLELDRVEAGYRRARQELADAKSTAMHAEHEAAMKSAMLDNVTQTIETLAGELEPETVDLDALRQEARDLQAAGVLASSDTAQAEAALQAHDQRITEVTTLRRQAERKVVQFTNLGARCNACDQDVPHEHRDAHVQAAQADADAHVATLAILQSEWVALAFAVQEAKAAEAKLRDAYADNVTRGREAVAARKRNEARQAKLEAVGVQLDEAEQALADAREKQDAARLLVAELTAAAEVLSYQGVRAALLDAAVSSLQDMANAWLQRLGLSSLRVTLSSQSETKAGKVNDKISFDVHGAGGGLGYLAASTGEQRRIDIAMLLAVGELAAHARGLSSASTMFADELFDGLDLDGQEAVVELLTELATTRCVVVISHNPELVSRLNPALHLVAKSGALTEGGLKCCSLNS